jgi:threonine/homoserine/homoserine lactone efflux protein
MIHHFWLFALAGFLLNITPGNDMIYVASRSAAQGVRAGIVSALGIMAGCLVHVGAAAAGLSVLLARSAMAFDVIKYVGAGYLVYLGLKALFSRKATNFGVGGRVVKQGQSADGGNTSGPASYRRFFLQGVVTNVLNPKVALFFLAFLPQFIDVRGEHAGAAILLLGAWFNVVGTLVNVLVAVLFGRIGEWLKRNPRWLTVQEKITGLVLVALGIKVALTTKQ